MKERCLQQISQVKAVIINNSQSYTYRSRLGRLIISCLRLISNELGISQPILPGLYKVPLGTPIFIENIINHCNKVWEINRVLSQPSEPLDERWKIEWAELNNELDLLYKCITEIRVSFNPEKLD